MTPEAKAHLDRARDHLRRAEMALTSMLQEPLTAEDAARNAYYAAFHAAHALIDERTGGNPKKHGSLHRAFADVARSDAQFDDALRKFLVVAYEFKLIGDYGTDPAKRVTQHNAALAVAEAKRFVAVVAALLP